MELTMLAVMMAQGIWTRNRINPSPDADPLEYPAYWVNS
jgi:hypothetical protein